MQTLPDALARRHADRIRFATPVRAVHAEHGSYRVVTDGEEFRARHVVLTAPAPAAADMVAPASPAVADCIRPLHYNPLAVVHLHAETQLHGLGYQVSFAETLVTRGVTWNDSLFGRKGVYTAYLGGARHPEVMHQSEESLGKLAVAEFRMATGYDATPLAVARERMPAWDHTWQSLQGLALPPGLHICAGLPGRLLQAKRLAAKLAAERATAL
jgi:protoporphyrinogen oxidase